MTTQVRPLTGGAWNNVSVTSQKNAKKDTTYGITLPTGLSQVAMRALNQWMNAGGVGTAAVQATQIAAAVGLQVQEI
jgi:hypothetical protein